MAWKAYNLWEDRSDPNTINFSDLTYFLGLNAKYPQYHGVIQRDSNTGAFRLSNDNGDFYMDGNVVFKNGTRGTYDTSSGHIIKSAPTKDPLNNKNSSNLSGNRITRPISTTGNSHSFRNFKLAFDYYRKLGKGIFNWNGKTYNTMTKDDNVDSFRRNHADYDAFIGNVAKDLGGWNPSDPVATSNELNQVPEEINTPTTTSLPATTPTTPTRLSMFTDDDIRNLGFRNYSGLVSAVNNKANANNPFVKALINRYTADTSKWDLAAIEKDLGVKGTYRSFGGGDFGDMSRSMAGWIGKNNGEIDRLDLLDRTGKDGTVYSNKKMRDFFDNITLRPKENKSLFDTSSFGQNIFGTPKKLQGGQLNMDEQQMQLAFLQYLMQKTGAQDQLQLEQVILLMGEEGLKLAYAQFIQEMQQLQVQAAKFGAKLNYIKQLNGLCPEGMEMHYYKAGGRLCKKCMLVKQNKEKTEEPSNPIDTFKCGRKIKKHLLGGAFQLAFNAARKKKQRYFWYKGRTYNTMNKGENREQWAKNFIDNSTSGGSNSVQTDVGYSGGWQGVKGANVGRYDSHGNWIRAKAPAKNAVVGARGDSVRNSDYKTFAPIDKPSDTVIVNGRGTDRGVLRTNKTKNYSIGATPTTDPSAYTHYGSTPMVNFLPGGYQSNGGSYVTTPITPWPWLLK